MFSQNRQIFWLFMIRIRQVLYYIYITYRIIVLHVSMNITIMWFLEWTEKWPGKEVHKDSSELQAANGGHYQASGEGQKIKERGGSPEEAGESHREDGANSGETAQRQEQEVHRSVLFPIQRLGLRTQRTTNQCSHILDITSLSRTTFGSQDIDLFCISIQFIG